MFLPMVVLVDIFVEPWGVQQIVRVVSPSIQVQKHQHNGEEEIDISVFIHSEVDCAIVAIDNPAS